MQSAKWKYLKRLYLCKLFIIMQEIDELIIGNTD